MSIYDDRLTQITKTMQELENIHIAMEKHKDPLTAIIIQVGECDQLEELHRLLYEVR